MDTLDKLMHPKSHVTHTALFVLCAIFTIVYCITSKDNVGGVELTTFRMLKLEDVESKLVIDTKNALLMKWKCTNTTNSTAVAVFEPWGPDSMCRCIRSEECSGVGCKEMEKNCYATKVPSYAYVSAGYDDSYWNIVIAFFLIHIAVMLNMFIETREEEIRKNRFVEESGREPNALKSIVEDYEDGETIVAASRLGMTFVTDLGEYVIDKNGKRVLKITNNAKKGKKRSGQGPRGMEKNNDNDDESSTSLIKKDQLQQDNPGESDDQQEHSGHWFTNAIQNKTLRFCILLILSIVCLCLSAVSIEQKTGKRGIGQTCDGGTCMTETLLSTITMTLAILDVLFFAWGVYAENHDHASKEYSVFKMTVWEDIHNTVAFMLLVSSFSARSGVHDDTTNLFDVLMIMFIGFMQSIQHIIMLQREEVISYCQDKGLQIHDEFERKHTVEKTIMSYFLYTRLFVFLVIICTVFVFIERLQPSIPSNSFTATWNYYLRSVTLLLSLTPAVISDISYEVNHVVQMKATGEYTPYVGAHVWRRAVFLCSILTYIIISWKTYDVDASALPL